MAVKYLVSGGEGALGKTVISMLLQRGEKVRILRKSENPHERAL